MKRLSYESVKNAFYEQGCVLLSKEYNGNKSELQYTCKKHPDVVLTTTFNSFSKRTVSGCKLCANASIGSKLSYDILFVASEFSKRGYELLSPDYKNANQKLSVKCRKGHITDMKFNNFIRGHECKVCSYEKKSGSASNLWNGGVSTENELERKSDKYKQWRSEVFRRDSYTCQCCGSNVGGSLVAHHLESFSNNTELRYSVGNGVTLCNECHDPKYPGSFHNTYGTRNNTRIQYEEWIANKQSK